MPLRFVKEKKDSIYMDLSYSDAVCEMDRNHLKSIMIPWKKEYDLKEVLNFLYQYLYKKPFKTIYLLKEDKLDLSSVELNLVPMEQKKNLGCNTFCTLGAMPIEILEPTSSKEDLKRKLKEEQHIKFRDQLFLFLDELSLNTKEGKKALRLASMISSATLSNLDLNPVVPQKKTVYQFCLALPLTLNEAEELLGSSGYVFNESDEKENLIKIMIEEREAKLNRKALYSVMAYNEYLYDITKESYFIK